jgi:uncharacterized protein
MAVLLWVAGVALVVIGIAGIVFPALPGTVLIFAGLLLAAWADGFTRVGAWTLALVGVLGALSYTVDFVAAALGARHVGASPRAVVGAGLGTLLGIPFGLPGVLIGPLVGAVLGELSLHRQFGRAAGCRRGRGDRVSDRHRRQGRARVRDDRDLSGGAVLVLTALISSSQESALVGALPTRAGSRTLRTLRPDSRLIERIVGEYSR